MNNNKTQTDLDKLKQLHTEIIAEKTSLIARTNEINQILSTLKVENIQSVKNIKNKVAEPIAPTISVTKISA